jgi:exodeoxyribonuclease VII large subunit
MTQFSLFAPQFWNVSELTRYLRDIFESDPTLQDLWVQGEISNLSRPASGHLYFTLKDSSSSLRCVMWRTAVNRQDFIPRDGQAVEVHGNLNIYEAGGQYQLYADLIRTVGEGALFQEFLRLKARLEEEGLFNPERKRPIPQWPKCIGIITSPTGAALRDILNTIDRRYPLVEIILAPSAVQGVEAPIQLIDALDALNKNGKPDMILLARGGGSIEDLWAFNDERLARAIAASTIPIISGVGHETDFTIADFVSDLRAPTPTAAAEMVTPNRADLVAIVLENKESLERSIRSFLDMKHLGLEQAQARMKVRSPLSLVQSSRQRVDELLHRSNLSLYHNLDIRSTRLAGLERRLVSLNPVSILQRGYSIVTHDDGQIVSSVRQVRSGDRLGVRVQDGLFRAIAHPSKTENLERPNNPSR